MSTEMSELGPVDYLVVEFPEGTMTGEAFPLLVDLVDRGLIRVLDLAFVRREGDVVTVVELEDLDRDGSLDLTVFRGASSGLLGSDDLDRAGGVLEPGSIGAVLVYENVWAAPFATALRRSGAQLVATGRIPLQDLLEVLEESESVR